MIVHDKRGVAIPLSAVAKYQKMLGGEVELELLNGDRHVCEEGQVERAWQRTAVASFPAEGAKLVKVYGPEDRAREEAVTWTEHLVGFITNMEGLTIPVSLDGPEEDGVVLFADGVVRSPLEEWPSREAYEEELRQAEAPVAPDPSRLVGDER